MAKGNYFFALWPDLEVRKQLAAEARECDSQGRLHNPLDLHMTLVYLGPVADSQMRCIEGVADSIASSFFTLQIDGLGFWHRPRILWAGPKQTPETLSQLVFDLQQGLEACGFHPERRRYKPHVTLYRKSVAVEPMVIEPAIKWPVREFVLAVSGINKPGEPRYRILKRWPLAEEG
jgi:2'-5' RNA ligase